MATQPHDTTETQRDRAQQSRTGRTGSRSAKRLLTAALGGLLVVRGLKRRSLGGLVTVLLGGWLLARARQEPSHRSRERKSAATSTRTDEASRGTEPTAITRSVTIGKSADELYDAWTDPQTFAKITRHFAQVTARTEDRYHWSVQGPLDRTFSWETQIVDREPGEYIRWETPPAERIQTHGRVEFREAPGDRGTEVTLRMHFEPPGPLGQQTMDRLGIVPETVIGEMLRRFKRLAETGELPTLEDNPSARGKGDML